MKGVYSGLYIRNDTTNLANFTSKNSNLGTIIQGSTLHCYKNGNTTTTIYFYAPISSLTDNQTYYLLMKKEYGTNPSLIAFLNSSGTVVQSFSFTTSLKSFTKTSLMDRIRIMWTPSAASCITVMLSDTLSKTATYIPYIQHVALVANGSNYVEMIYRGKYLLYYDGSVIRYKTVGNYKQLVNTTYGYKIDAHELNNDSSHYYICTLRVYSTFPGKIFGNSNKVNWLVIPDTVTGIDNSYKINNLNSTGDVYIHKDCGLLTYSEFMANFKGWNVWLYDTDYKDIVGHTDMTIGNYGYGN